MYKRLIQNTGNFEHPMFLLTIVNLARRQVDWVVRFIHPSPDGSSFGDEETKSTQSDNPRFLDFKVRWEDYPESAASLDRNAALEDNLVCGILTTVLEINVVEVICIKRRWNCDSLHRRIVQLCDQVLFLVHDFEDETFLVFNDRIVEFANIENDLGVVILFGS